MCIVTMTRSTLSVPNPESLVNLRDDELQAILLEGVSRTFALTIPQLPGALYSVVIFFAVEKLSLLSKEEVVVEAKELL